MWRGSAEIKRSGAPSTGFGIANAGITLRLAPYSVYITHALG